MDQAASLLGTQALGCRNLTVQPDYPKGQVLCGTVYGNMHYTVFWDQSEE